MFLSWLVEFYAGIYAPRIYKFNTDPRNIPKLQEVLQRIVPESWNSWSWSRLYSVNLTTNAEMFGIVKNCCFHLCGKETSLEVGTDIFCNDLIESAKLELTYFAMFLLNPLSWNWHILQWSYWIRLVSWLQFLINNFPANFSDWWMRYFLWKFSEDECHWTLLMINQH